MALSEDEVDETRVKPENTPFVQQCVLSVPGEKHTSEGPAPWSRNRVLFERRVAANRKRAAKRPQV